MYETDRENLLKQASGLSVLIKKTETYKEYTRIREILNNDPDASRLVEKLVETGRIIAENINTGSHSSSETITDLESLKKDIEANVTAMEYLDSQKKYLELLDQVIAKIINPDPE